MKAVCGTFIRCLPSINLFISVSTRTTATSLHAHALPHRCRSLLVLVWQTVGSVDLFGRVRESFHDYRWLRMAARCWRWPFFFFSTY